MTVQFTLSDYEFMAINGGPLFKFNPSISYFVVCETEDETTRLWNALAEGGSVLMPLDKYDWSEKYGWVQDKYGLSWQISSGKLSEVGQKITPMIMYVNKNTARAEEAVKLLTSIFPHSAITGILHYTSEEKELPGSVKHAQFSLSGGTFMAMDSSFDHKFNFNEAISFVVHCRTQQEIDYYWEKLTAGGIESECGWLKDKFGMSWQVVPDQLNEMLATADPEKTERPTNAFLKMKKFDIAALQKAFEGG